MVAQIFYHSVELKAKVARQVESHQVMEFQQDEVGTKAMFARERRSRERYNCCIADDTFMPTGSFFKEE